MTPDQIRAAAFQSVMLGEVDISGAPPFQGRVHPWMMACFGPMIAGDREERNHRFVEEALELAQACGCTAHEAHQLVNYVFGRPIGEKPQEVGGVMVTLAALCLAHGLNMHRAGEVELARIWTRIEAIREKQAAKPKHSPLPASGLTDSLSELNRRVEIEQYLLDCARGKHPLPNAETCRRLALRLGTPKDHWSDILKEPLP